MNKKPECLTFKEAIAVLNECVQHDEITNCDILVVDFDADYAVTYLATCEKTLAEIAEDVENNDIILVKRNKW